MKALLDEEFSEIVTAPDLLTLGVRGHSAIDLNLRRFLSESLPAAHEVELDRLSFSLKLDLAVALKGLRAESRPLFQRLNQLRNRLAHHPSATFTQKEADALIACFSEHQKELSRHHRTTHSSPLAAVKLAVVIGYFEVEGAVEGAINRRLHARALTEEIDAYFDGKSDTPSSDESKSLRAKLDSRITELRKERNLKLKDA